MPSDPLQSDEEANCRIFGGSSVYDESFCSCYLQNFLFVFVSLPFNMTFLGADHFALILLGIHQVSWICSLRLFFRFWKFLFFISLNVFLFIDILWWDIVIMSSFTSLSMAFFSSWTYLWQLLWILFANPTSGSSQRQILLLAFSCVQVTQASFLGVSYFRCVVVVESWTF